MKVTSCIPHASGVLTRLAVLTRVASPGVSGHISTQLRRGIATRIFNAMQRICTYMARDCAARQAVKLPRHELVHLTRYEGAHRKMRVGPTATAS